MQLSDLTDYFDYNRELLDLIAMLEPIVAQNFENQQERGRFSFRYPVRIERNGIEMEGRGGYIPNLTTDELDTLRYVVGANSLYIGKALLLVLKFLEYRYIGDLDFAELEKKYRAGYYSERKEQFREKHITDSIHGLNIEFLFE